MRLTFLAEYDGAIRTAAGTPTICDDVSAAYRECARRLEARPRAHRVEAWDGGRCVVYARRGVDVEHGPLCFETCCMGTAKNGADTRGEGGDDD